MEGPRSHLKNMEIEEHITPDRLRQDVQHIKDWMDKEPHLPKISDEEWLITFMHHNKYSLEKTKKKLESYFSFRNKYPDILKNRDPLGDDVALARRAFNCSLSEKLTKDGGRILFNRFNEDTSLFNVTNHLKRLFMIVDLFYLEHDRHDSLLSVTDCQNLSYTYFLKALPGIKTGMDIFFTAYSDRLKAFHIINASPGLETVLNGFKSFLPAKIADRFFVHPSIDDLIRILGEDAICIDFGGKGPSYSECDEYTTKLIEKHRKWFLKQDDITVNDRLRRKTNNHVEKMKGSFRKLEVD